MNFLHHYAAIFHKIYKNSIILFMYSWSYRGKTDEDAISINERHSILFVIKYSSFFTIQIKKSGTTKLAVKEASWTIGNLLNNLLDIYI